MENNIQDKDKQLDELIDFIAVNKKHFDSKEGYALFKARVEAEDFHPAKGNMFIKWISVAAVLIPFIFLSYFTYQYFTFAPEEEQISFFSKVVVPNGSKTQLVLQDGTNVWINSGSTIQCNANYGKEYREIQLIGEAYLEVAHLENCPFIVSTGEVKVKVLGTRFNVNAYKENDEIKIALLEGSVEMTTQYNDPYILSPKDVALYNVTSKQTKIHHNASGDIMGWIDNKFLFEGDTFEQIARTLERNFNVKINILKVSLKGHRFAGDFVNNETIEQIFSVMSSNGKFNYKIRGNIIDVY